MDNVWASFVDFAYKHKIRYNLKHGKDWNTNDFWDFIIDVNYKFELREFNEGLKRKRDIFERDIMEPIENKSIKGYSTLTNENPDSNNEIKIKSQKTESIASNRSVKSLNDVRNEIENDKVEFNLEKNITDNVNDFNAGEALKESNEMKDIIQNDNKEKIGENVELSNIYEKH